MQKILFILLFFPIICFASFPVVTDTKEAEKITFSIDYDFNQKTIDDKNNIEIIKSSYETNSFWKVYRLLRRIFLAVVIIVVIVSLLTNIN